MKNFILMNSDNYSGKSLARLLSESSGKNFIHDYYFCELLVDYGISHHLSDWDLEYITDIFENNIVFKYGNIRAVEHGHKFEKPQLNWIMYQGLDLVFNLFGQIGKEHLLFNFEEVKDDREFLDMFLQEK